MRSQVRNKYCNDSNVLALAPRKGKNYQPLADLGASARLLSTVGLSFRNRPPDILFALSMLFKLCLPSQGFFRLGEMIYQSIQKELIMHVVCLYDDYPRAA